MTENNYYSMGKTMDDEYEDGSDHKVCEECGFCKTCEDCKCGGVSK